MADLRLLAFRKDWRTFLTPLVDALMFLMDVQVSAVDLNPQVCLKQIMWEPDYSVSSKSLHWCSYKHGGRAKITVLLDAVPCSPRELCRWNSPASGVSICRRPTTNFSGIGLFKENPSFGKLIHLTFDHKPLCRSYSEQFQRLGFVQAPLKNYLAPYVLPSTCLSVNLEECKTSKIHFVASSTKRYRIF